MHRKLTPQSSLENLKREAKRWLKALRDHDAEARARFESAYPKAPAEPTLRDAQHALALEHGLSSWVELKDAVENAVALRDPRTAALDVLLDAADKGDAARVAAVLDEHPDIVSERGTLRGHTGLRTALHFAVGAGDEAVVKLLLDRGADPNVRDEGDNAMPLHFVAEKERLDLIKLLIEHGADPIGAGDDHELEVIGWATCFGSARPDVVEYLLTHGARHNIFSAVATGNVAAIRTLAASRRDDLDRPMDRTNHRRRPLHLAVIKKQAESLAALLELGADIEATDAAGLTPLDQAALADQNDLAQMLIDRRAKIGVPAAIALDHDVDRVLAEHPGALAPGGRYEGLILRVAERGSGRMIERLIRHGASPNQRDDTPTSIDSVEGYTPLHAAAFAGNRSAVEALLAHGANVQARDAKFLGTPAGWADYAGHGEVRDLILEGPIDMFEAIAFDRVDRFREIFDRNASALQGRLGRRLLREPGPDDRIQAWWSPLVFAVMRNKPAAVKELLEMGARPGERDPNGRSLIEIASALGHHEIVALLQRYEPRVPDLTGDSGDALIARFLWNACPDHHVRGGWAHAVARDTALNLLERHPEIARTSLYTAVVCGDIEEARRIIAERPEAAREKGGPRGSGRAGGQTFTVEPGPVSPPRWEPLLYLCFTRLPTRAASENAIEIARLLLDNGGDPNAYFMAGDSRYSPLCGVFGEGEEDRVPHPQRDALVRLLLERGANPYDMQLFYNIHFRGDILWYLELVHEQSVKQGRAAEWGDPQLSMIDEGGYGQGARYLLMIAVRRNDTALASWVLARGADPNAMPPAWAKPPRTHLYDEAVRRGHLEVAELLARAGAKTGGEQITVEQRLVDATFRGDRAEMRRLVERHPELLRSTTAIFDAADRDRADVVEYLLDLGMSTEVEDNGKQRPLHMAAYSNALRVAQLLIDRGAEIDPVESSWGNTPIDAAIYSQHTAMIELLGRYSRDIWSLTFTGQVDRVRELLREKPSRATVESEGTTLLMVLPGDEGRALEIAQLLLANGADPTSRDSNGTTAAEMASRRGMDEVAKLLAQR